MKDKMEKANRERKQRVTELITQRINKEIKGPLTGFTRSTTDRFIILFTR